MTFGNPHRHYRSTNSTNTRARELAAAGAPHGTVVTAGEQTAGRGRQGRTWTAPPNKALLYSAIVRPLEDHHTLLPLAVPLAVCEAAEAPHTAQNASTAASRMDRNCISLLRLPDRAPWRMYPRLGRRL